MNGTVIDIPGITVSVVSIDLNGSTDQSHLITLKDAHGNTIYISSVSGRISSVSHDPKVR